MNLHRRSISTCYMLCKNENENLSVLQVLRNLLLAGAGLLSSVSAAPQFGPLGPAHHAPLHHGGPGYAPAKIPPRPFAYEYGVQVGVILTSRLRII